MGSAAAPASSLLSTPAFAAPRSASMRLSTFVALGDILAPRQPWTIRMDEFWEISGSSGGGSKPIIIKQLLGWTSIYQLFWGDRKKGVISIDVLSIVIPFLSNNKREIHEFLVIFGGIKWTCWIRPWRRFF